MVWTKQNRIEGDEERAIGLGGGDVGKSQEGEDSVKMSEFSWEIRLAFYVTLRQSIERYPGHQLVVRLCEGGITTSPSPNGSYPTSDTITTPQYLHTPSRYASAYKKEYIKIKQFFFKGNVVTKNLWIVTF